MRSHSILMISVLLMSLSSVVAHAEDRIALVIGIDKYTNLPASQQLRNAANDANAMTMAFTNLGFDVVSGINLTRREFNRKLVEFDQKLKPGDTAAVYFAGHGVQILQNNYLLPGDIPQAKSNEEELLIREAISLHSLLDLLEKKGTRINLIVLDACRDNPFEGGGSRGVGGARGLTRVTPPSGTFIMYSAGANQTALDRLSDDDPDPNSVYTRTLLPLLARPGQSIVSLAKDVQVRVTNLAKSVKHTQVPAYYDQITGNYSLNPSNDSSKPEKITPGLAKPERQPASESVVQQLPAQSTAAKDKLSAAERRQQVGEEAYLDCVQKNSLNCYNRFLEKFRDHPRAPQVEKIRKAQIELPKYRACEEADSVHEVIKACQFYIDAFPTGEFQGLAKSALDDAKLKLGTEKTPSILTTVPAPAVPSPVSSMHRMANVDLHGMDLFASGVRNVSVNQCEELCLGDSRCRAFTWVAAKHWCWPKSGVGGTSYGAGMISGVKPGTVVPGLQTTPSGPQIQMIRMNGIDLSGGDLLPNGSRPTSLNQCVSMCMSDFRCKAFTWIADKNWCWPKFEIGRPRRNSRMISGRKP